jgi:hypothetical protein
MWDVALHEQGPFNQAYMVGQLAGYITTLIGKLEAQPSLLHLPKPQPSDEPSSASSVLQPITIHGGTVYIAQTGTGDVSPQIGPHKEVAEVRALLADLDAAIRDIEAPEAEIEGFLEPVEQLDAELAKPRPLLSRLTRSWGAIQAMAAIEGAWQNWERVQRIAIELGPKAHDVIQAITRATGGA